MRMFIENSTNPIRPVEKKHVIPVGIWPVRDRHADYYEDGAGARRYEKRLDRPARGRLRQADD